MLVSALATELIGIHATFGAFPPSAAIPSGTGVARELTSRLEDVVSVLFLPFFFAYAGLRTELKLISSGFDWLVFAVIIVVACLVEFGGSTLSSRLSGLNWR